MRGVIIDVPGRRARVAAGTLWLEVTTPASEHGLAPLAGSSPDVGVVGYSLGGGVSWLARKHGLSANSILAIEIVTADGRLRRVDAEHDADLFWALRGGGGSFGVVTAMEIALYPMAELYAGAMFWPWERSSEIMHAWREWTLTAPDEVTSSARIMQIPPLPDVPEPLRGRSFVTIDAAVIGNRAFGAEVVQALRDLGPEIDTFDMVAPVALSRLHNDPEAPVPVMSEHRLLGDLPAEAIDAFVAVAGPDSGSRAAARRDPPPRRGARRRRAGPRRAGPPRRVLPAVRRRDRRVTRDGRRPEVRAAGVQGLHGAVGRRHRLPELRGERRRLAEVLRRGHAPPAGARRRRQVDPADMFRSNHPIKPVTGGHAASR